MVLYFFAVPVVLVVSSNLIMFAVVVLKVARAPDMSDAVSKQRNNIHIYAKLTTLTGVTWSFGFVHQHIPIEALSYTYIVLNGCQGLYILMAFVFNRRVMDLFKARMSRGQMSTKLTPKTTCTHTFRTPKEEGVMEENKNGIYRDMPYQEEWTNRTEEILFAVANVVGREHFDQNHSFRAIWDVAFILYL